jgi:hypothetical protein
MSESSNFFPELGRRCRGPISRRSFLEAGALSLLGLGMSDILRAETVAKAAGRKTREKSVIFIWLPGGMSHLESYDMKPNAPLEYRGIFSPIKTNVPGIEVCEHLPRHAKIADKYALIRSVCHEFADHGGRPQALPHGPRAGLPGWLRQRCTRRHLDHQQGAQPRR